MHMLPLKNEIIWFDPTLNLSKLPPLTTDTLGSNLGMEWVAVGENFMQIKMPVDARTHQPYGLLHGGASCALAETVGSVASHYVIDSSRFMCVGLEINANHIRAVRSGFVTATATPLHLGATTHVWDIKIVNDVEKLICVSRLTVAILKKKTI